MSTINMKPQLSILSHLFQRLKYIQPVEGILHGIHTIDGHVIAVAISAKSPETEHDVNLLLPPPLSPIGKFSVCKGDFVKPELEDGEVAVIWDQKELQTFARDDGSTLSTTYSEISENEFYDMYFIARVSYSLDLTSKDSSSSIKNAIRHMKELLESPAACFRLQKSTLLLQNSEDGVKNLGGIFSDVEEEIAEILQASGKKKSIYQTAVFQLMLNRSCGSDTYAPVVRIDNRKATVMSTHLNGEIVLHIAKSTPVCNVAKILAAGALQQLDLAEYWLNKQLQNDKYNGPLSSYNSLHYITGHLTNIMYPENCDEADLEQYRRGVHKSLLFPLDRPVVRKLNKLPPLPENKQSVLMNTHIGLKPSDVYGEISIVPGTYGYHHYMQDRFDDNKWGCAYRSLQTVISWLRYQGYTDKPIPSHKEIQKCLVNIGDKPYSFIGSTQWIGSTEVGFVLESMFNVTSRFINVGSGSDLAYKGRELAMHFKVQGTPIMIGGGVLAHTIIGVDFNSETGDISFLILDPHYTGSEDLNAIQGKGWCGWKGPEFWKADAYYNLCLPQRPPCL